MLKVRMSSEQEVKLKVLSNDTILTAKRRLHQKVSNFLFIYYVLSPPTINSLNQWFLIFMTSRRTSPMHIDRMLVDLRYTRPSFTKPLTKRAINPRTVTLRLCNGCSSEWCVRPNKIDSHKFFSNHNLMEIVNTHKS